MHGQKDSSSNIEHVNLPVDHVDSIDRQFSRENGYLPQPFQLSDQLIDPQMSLDPQFLVPIEDSMGSDPIKEYTFVKQVQ